MEWIFDFLTNPYLITAVSSWAIAQVLKVLINGAFQKKLSLERLFGDGGMPSGHSATVTSLAVFMALRHGTGSYQFAIAAILAAIVCHDAMGVRQETGKQAMLLNEVLKSFTIADKELQNIKLKELVGHTPLQVLAGILLGFANAFFMYYIVLS